MTAIANSRALATGDFHHQNPEFHLLLALNKDRFYAVCVLLQGQLLMELSLFRKNVQQLIDRGYPLKSLVAELHCSSENGIPKFWTCDVRPKTESIYDSRVIRR